MLHCCMLWGTVERIYQQWEVCQKGGVWKYLSLEDTGKVYDTPTDLPLLKINHLQMLHLPLWQLSHNVHSTKQSPLNPSTWTIWPSIGQHAEGSFPRFLGPLSPQLFRCLRVPAQNPPFPSLAANPHVGTHLFTWPNHTNYSAAAPLLPGWQMVAPPTMILGPQDTQRTHWGKMSVSADRDQPLHVCRQKCIPAHNHK